MAFSNHQSFYFVGSCSINAYNNRQPLSSTVYVLGQWFSISPVYCRHLRNLTKKILVPASQLQRFWFHWSEVSQEWNFKSPPGDSIVKVEPLYQGVPISVLPVRIKAHKYYLNSLYLHAKQFGDRLLNHELPGKKKFLWHHNICCFSPISLMLSLCFSLKSFQWLSTHRKHAWTESAKSSHKIFW